MRTITFILLILIPAMAATSVATHIKFGVIDERIVIFLPIVAWFLGFLLGRYLKKEDL